MQRLSVYAYFSFICLLGCVLPLTVAAEQSGAQKVLFLMDSESALNRAQQVVHGFRTANLDLDNPNDFLVIQTRLSRDSNEQQRIDLQRQIETISDLDFIVVSWLPELEFAATYLSDQTIINLSPVSSESEQVITLANDLDERIYRTGQLARSLPQRSDTATVIAADFSGDTAFKSRVTEQLQLAGYQSLRFIESRSLPQMTEAVAQLSAADTVFYFPLTEDSNGERHLPKEVVAQLAKQTDAPIFSMWSNFIGNGAVGGYAFNPELAGEAVVQLIDDLNHGRDSQAYSTSTLFIDETAFEKLGGELDQVFGRVTLVNESSSLISGPALLTVSILLVFAGLGWALLFYVRRALIKSKQLRQTESCMGANTGAGRI